MIQRADVRAAVLALFVLSSFTFTFSQQKERNRKLDAAQKATSAAAESTARSDKDKDEKNEGDPIFKGMECDHGDAPSLLKERERALESRG